MVIKLIKESASWIIPLWSGMYLTWIFLAHTANCVLTEKLESEELMSENLDDMTFVRKSLSDCLNLLEEEGSGTEEADIEELSEDYTEQSILLFGSSLVKSLIQLNDEEEDRHHLDKYDSDSDLSSDVSDMEQNMQNSEARYPLGGFLSGRLKTRNQITAGVHSWSISRLRTSSSPITTIETTGTTKIPFSTTPVSSSLSPVTSEVTTSLVTQSPNVAETVRLLASTLSLVELVTTSVGRTESSASLHSTKLASTEEPKSSSEISGETGSRNVNTTLSNLSQSPASSQIDMTTKSSIFSLKQTSSIISLQQDEIGGVKKSTLVPQPVLQTSTPSTFQTEVLKYNLNVEALLKIAFIILQDSTARTVVYTLQGDSSVLYVVIATIPCLLLILITLGWLCIRRQTKLRPRLESEDSYVIVPKSEVAEDTSFLTNMTSSTTLRTIPDVVPHSVFLAPGVSMPNINKNDTSWETGTGRSLSDFSLPGQSPGAPDIEAGRKRWQSDNRELEPSVGCETPLVGVRWRSEDWEKDQGFMTMIARRLEVVNSNAEITEL